MSNEKTGNSLQIVFDSNSSTQQDSSEKEKDQTPQPQQQTSETEEGKGTASRGFRGVNWDDASTNLLLDIYKSKFPILESTPHNKGRKQIYEEMQLEFNSNEHIENKRTLKSLTRKWGEMLAKYRYRRGEEAKTGKLPDVYWKYHDRMHEIVGHLPQNGRITFPMTNTIIESNSFIPEKFNNDTAAASTSSNTAITKATQRSEENTTSDSTNKRARTEDLETDKEENDELSDTSVNSTQAPTENATTPAPTSAAHIRPIQPKVPLPRNQCQYGNSPAAKVPRRIEPKRNITQNNNEKGKGRGQKTKEAPIIIRPSPTPIHEHASLQNRIVVETPSIHADNHDIRNALEQILELGRVDRSNERVAQSSTMTGQAISESLHIIAEASRQMAESNRILAQQVENNAKTTVVLLEGMKALIQNLNSKDNTDNGYVEGSNSSRNDKANET